MKRFRYWLKGLTVRLMVPIRTGPLAGMRFGLFTGMRFLRGDYDDEDISLFARHIKAGDVVYDVGAHVGYYSLVAARLVGAQGSVVAFEPSALNSSFLAQHVRANHLGNVTLIRAGVCERTGEAHFATGKGTGRGHLSNDGGTTIPLVSLDELWRAGTIRPPNVIKMDIEGAEARALQGARALFSEYRPVLMLSVHGAAMREQCSAFLAEFGYELHEFRRSTFLAIMPAKPAQLPLAAAV
jgi:FkbM family methyltransferase